MAQKNNTANIGVIVVISVFTLFLVLNSHWLFAAIGLLAYGLYRWLSKKNSSASSIKKHNAVGVPLITPNQQEKLAKAKAEFARLAERAAKSAIGNTVSAEPMKTSMKIPQSTQQSSQIQKTSTLTRQARQALQELLEVDEPEFFVQVATTASNSYSIPSAPPESQVRLKNDSSRRDDAKLAETWIAPGQDITLYGYPIRGGMLYVGNKLRADYNSLEALTIDTAYPIDSKAHFAASLASYWPSYSRISEQARGAYIKWLADGRSAPDVDIGYVFLYYYGLERRLLVDILNKQVGREEVPAIQAEVRRLLDIYGKQSSSFERYCRCLLEFMEIFDENAAKYSSDVARLGVPYEMSSQVKIALGQAARAGVPIPAHLALAWAEQDPSIVRRTAVTRCATQFKQLFLIKYRQVYDTGLKVSPNKTKLCLSYYPATPGMHGEVKFKTDLPDLSVLSVPQKKLQEIVDACDLALGPFSRYRLKNPDAPEMVDGVLVLPLEIWPVANQEALKNIIVGVRKEMQITNMRTLAAQLGHDGEVSKDMMAALAASIRKENIQFEPDVFASTKTPKAEDKFVLFANLVQARPSPEDTTTPAYHAALVTLELAAAVAHADGDFSADELQLMQTYIASWQHLSQQQRQRLNARLLLLREKPISLTSLKKKIEPLDMQARETIGNFAASIVHADGDVSPDEVKLLEKIFTLLGLERSQVYSRIHAASTPAAPSIAFTSAPLSNAVIAPSTQSFALDHQKIAALEKESEKVSALLANIFNDEATPAADMAAPMALESTALVAEEVSAVVPNEQNNLLGLDENHSHFLRILISRKVWQRAELADLAQDLEMMLDGALEHINEAAFDAFDLPMTEGDDPIEINPELLEKISV